VRATLGGAVSEATPALDWSTCDRARVARDPRFDGWFFTGVRTTGIYCRPTCPVKPAKSRNVTFFATAAAAERAGFRPCLRCRPESAPGTPAWKGAAATVTRARRFIERGFLDEHSVDELSETLGVGARHLRRLFLRHAGASPREVAATRRVQRAKTLLDETTMPIAAIAFASGFASIRRFNAAFLAVYRRSPSALRRRGGRIEGHPGAPTPPRKERSWRTSSTSADFRKSVSSRARRTRGRSSSTSTSRSTAVAASAGR
jgi:AraC family transcriptional regulator of adaptative response / DNA-3-methyladenine glycosylase II